MKKSAFDTTVISRTGESNDIDRLKTEFGMYGFLGDQANKPGNVVFLFVAAICLLIFVIVISPSTPDLPKKDMIFFLGGIASSAVAYLFGRSSKM